MVVNKKGTLRSASLSSNHNVGYCCEPTSSLADQLDLLIADHDSITSTQARVAILGYGRGASVVQIDIYPIGIAVAPIAVAFDGIAGKSTSDRASDGCRLAAITLANLVAQYAANDGTQHGTTA